MGLVTWHRNKCFASLDFVSMFFRPGKGSRYMKNMKNEIKYDIYTRIKMCMGSLKRKILKNSVGCRRCLCLLCTIQDNNTKKEIQFNIWKCNLNFIRFELYSVLFFFSFFCTHTDARALSPYEDVVFCPISLWQTHTHIPLSILLYCVADTICHCYPLRIFFNIIQFILHFKLKIVQLWSTCTNRNFCEHVWKPTRLVFSWYLCTMRCVLSRNVSIYTKSGT